MILLLSSLHERRLRKDAEQILASEQQMTT
jgi:hypothetical protein